MILRTGTAEVAAERERRRVADFVALTKPRVVLMVLVTTAAGFYLAAQGGVDGLRLVQTLLGTGLAAAGTMALNQFYERDIDALMERTRLRPLPDGRLEAGDAHWFGWLLIAAGVGYLALAVNLVSAAVVATISASYLFAYTPLKRISPICTIVGAIPGALPPVVGWVAVRGGAGIEAWTLFAILFLWQIPHSLAIAAVYREDYGRAGVRLLPVVEPDGASTARQVVTNSVALAAVGVLPALLGFAGPVYLGVALVLGLTFLGYGVAYARLRDQDSARNVVLASLLYLPLLLAAMAIDKIETPGILFF